MGDDGYTSAGITGNLISTHTHTRVRDMLARVFVSCGYDCVDDSQTGLHSAVPL